MLICPVQARYSVAAAILIFVAAVLISGPLFFRNRVVTVPCSSTGNQCATVRPSELFLDAGFRKAYHSIWAALGTFLPLVVLLGTSCGLVAVLYRSRTAGIASPDRYPCSRVTATVAAVVITYLLLVCPSTLTEVTTTTPSARNSVLCTKVLSRACERGVRGAENGAERVENRVTGSGAWNGRRRSVVCLFVCLGFNGTFSTDRLYHAITVG